MIKSKDQIIPVAVSGGKDSAATLFILDKLGYNVIPVIVDREDDPLFDSNKIKRSLEKLGYRPIVIKLRSCLSNCEWLSQEGKERIKNYLYKFDNLKPNESHCTPCYNARTTALIEYTKFLGAEVFVIGQHKTDLATSLLKFYWTEVYYQTYTKPYGIPYDGIRMKRLIESSEIDFMLLEQLVKEGKATTDDPPVEKFGEVRLVRPICEISERIIRRYIEAKGYPYESGNCTWRETNPRPFRLIVQFDLYNRLEKDPTLEDKLFEYVLMGLNPDGTLKYRPRNKRDIYWPGFKPFIRKL